MSLKEKKSSCKNINTKAKIVYEKAFRTVRRNLKKEKKAHE